MKSVAIYLILVYFYFEANGQNLQAVIYDKSQHNSFTANGERYNMYGLTAAHPDLAFNTLIEVRNLSNQKIVVVRVNDRTRRGELKLSYAAAKILDLRTSKVPVKLKVMGKSKNPPKVFLVQQDKPSQNPSLDLNYFKPIHTYTPEGKVINLSGRWGVQITQSSDLKDILKRVKEMESLLFKDVFIQVGWSKGEVSYRLLLGRFSTAKAAEPLSNFLTKAGLKPKIKPHF